jgi:transcriptional regulator GlxA family with amidase domain
MIREINISIVEAFDMVAEDCVVLFLRRHWTTQAVFQALVTGSWFIPRAGLLDPEFRSIQSDGGTD